MKAELFHSLDLSAVQTPRIHLDIVIVQLSPGGMGKPLADHPQFCGRITVETVRYIHRAVAGPLDEVSSEDEPVGCTCCKTTDHGGSPVYLDEQKVQIPISTFFKSCGTTFFYGVLIF